MSLGRFVSMMGAVARSRRHGRGGRVGRLPHHRHRNFLEQDSLMLDPDPLPYHPCLLALERERDWQHAAEACGVSKRELADIVRAAGVRHGHPLVKTGPAFEGFTPHGERVVALAKELQAGLEALEQCFTASRHRSTAWLRGSADVTGTA
jgi:hypothetical protein